MRVLKRNNWVLLEPIEDRTNSGLIQTEANMAKVVSSPCDELRKGMSVIYNDKSAVDVKEYRLVDVNNIYVVVE